MSFMEKIFGHAPAAQQQSQAATQQATPGNMPANQPPMSAGSTGTVPAAPVETGKEKPESQMAWADKLWENDPNAAKNEPEPIFNIDPEKLAAASKKIDFSKAVSPELMTRINAGGEEAQKAMLEAMNAMQQAAMAQGTTLNTKLIEQALEKQQEQFMARLPELIKNQNTRNTLQDSHPLLQDPATAPIMDAVLARVQQKFPNASAAEQRKQAEMYVTHFAEKAQAPEKAVQEQKTKANQTDWNDFLKDTD